MKLKFVLLILLGTLMGGAAHAASVAETRQALETLPGLSGVQAGTDAAGTLRLSGLLGGLKLNAILPAGNADPLVLLADADLPAPRWPDQTGGAVISLGGLTGSGLDAALKVVQTLLIALNRLDPSRPPLLAGTGVGGLAVILLLERRVSVAGGLALCAPVSGWAVQVAYLSDFRLVYDYFTRTLAGTRLSGYSDPTDPALLPDAAATAASVSALFAGAPTIDRFKANLGQIGDVTHVRADAGAYRTLLDAYTREVPRWQSAYGGFPYSNAATYYQSSMDDDPMNVGIVRTQAAPPAAALLAPLTPMGRWERPLLTLHDLSDPLYPEEAEGLLGSRAKASPLAQQVVQNVGAAGVQPCDLPDAAALSAYHELRTWALGGPKPADRTLDTQP
ncbi:hypothetical protein [Deinococcus sp.]|uniref:hypothetical protein n=1 Tax=Deinococcus sp. TaxID=47478 RepID=UPI003C7BAB30